MQVMILAAGRGQRLRPLTDKTPKPMIRVCGESMIERHVRLLRAQNFTDFVINGAWLKDILFDYVKDGSQWNVTIKHSPEEADGLETAGGIINALPLLHSDPFLVLNGDTVIEGDYAFLRKNPFDDKERQNSVAHLFLTQNPAHNSKGDFDLTSDGRLACGSAYTFSGIAFYRRAAFAGREVRREPLRPYFDRWIAEGRITAEVLRPKWFDVGTLERLAEAQEYLEAQQKRPLNTQ